MIAEYFSGLELDDLVVVAPDVGRVKLNHKFADMLGAELALMTKERPAQQVAEVGYVIGDVRGKTAVILDDIIDTAGTLTAAGQTVLDEGAARVFAACTHPVFSGQAYERLANSAFEQVVVTDTIPLRDRRARQRRRAFVRRAARRHDPPDLHRRVGERGVRRREPAVLAPRSGTGPHGPTDAERSEAHERAHELRTCASCRADRGSVMMRPGRGPTRGL